MSSSPAEKHACARQVIDTDNHPDSSSCLQNYDCCRASPKYFGSSKASDVSLGPTIPGKNEPSKDDMAISNRPFRQVDYLSHDWREEDIWSSWRYVVIGRGTLLDHVRLENAAWRTWAKVKNSLKTVPPETLNWFVFPTLHMMFDGKAYTSKAEGTELCQLPLRKSDSHGKVSKRPTIKWGSMSEEILDRSLSAGSVPDQATAAVDVWKTKSFSSPLVGHSRSQNPSQTIPKWPRNEDNKIPSTFKDPPRTRSLTYEQKRTRFNERVEQCIIVDGQVSEYDDNKPDDSYYFSDNDSDDGILVKCTKTRRWTVSQRKASELKLYEGRGIFILPPTALKSGGVTPEPRRADGQEFYHPPVPFSSSQDIRPAGQSMAVSIGTGGDNDCLKDVSLNSAIERPSQSAQDATGNLHRSTSSINRFGETAAKRRIKSGLFRPYEESRASSTDGILSLLGEALTSVRDIIYAVWSSARKAQ
ncbi:hypothetical protein LZL87_012985 [Fusarium oxysporum]|nr:hypothetical protein LZL87_012985 [Fusarium oxysporum]